MWFALSSFRLFGKLAVGRLVGRIRLHCFLVCGYFLLGSANLSEQCVAHVCVPCVFKVLTFFGISSVFRPVGDSMVFVSRICLFTAQSIFCAVCVFNISSF